MNVRSGAFYMTVEGGARASLHPQVVSANFNFSGRTPLPSTKCVATIGPACENAEMLESLIQAGVTGFRYNMSHVNDDDRLIETLQSVLRVRYLAEKLGRQVAIFSDMQGAEFRVQADEDLEFRVGDRVRFTTEPGQSHRNNGSLTVHLRAPEKYQLVRDLKRDENEKLFRQESRPFVVIDDGNVAIELDPWETLFEGSSDQYFRGTVRYGTKIKRNKGVNFPTLDLPHLPGMTGADNWVLSKIFNYDFVKSAWEVLSQKEPKMGEMVGQAISRSAFHLLGFDYIAPSFVRTAEDLDRFKHVLEGQVSLHVKLIPKIETLQAVQPRTLRKLLSHPWTIGIMVARGDLASQAGFTRVPYYQRLILNEARRLGRFSIVATDVLGSMTGGMPHATRAEHDGLFSLMEYGAHAFMLSNETAAGQTPLEVVRYGLATFQDELVERAVLEFGIRQMQQKEILQMREKDLRRKKRKPGVIAHDLEQEDLYLDTMKACLQVQDDPTVDGFVLWSHKGRSMRIAAQVLPEIPIFVVTDNPRVAREGAMTRGIYPILLRSKPQDGKGLEEIIRATIPAFLGKSSSRFKVMHNLG